MTSDQQYNKVFEKMKEVLTPDEIAIFSNARYQAGMDYNHSSKETVDRFNNLEKKIEEVKDIVTTNLGNIQEKESRICLAEQKIDNLTKVSDINILQHEKIDAQHKEVMDTLKPIAEVYKDMEFLGKTGKRVIIGLSILLGLMATASGLLWGWLEYFKQK